MTQTQMTGGVVVERRKHKRFPILADLAEPVEISIIDEHQNLKQIPGVLTNLSAGGMDLVLMGSIEGQPQIKMTLEVPGLNKFEVEARVVWTRPKGPTEILGLKFTKIDDDTARRINEMAEKFWEEERKKEDKKNQ